MRSATKIVSVPEQTRKSQAGDQIWKRDATLAQRDDASCLGEWKLDTGNETAPVQLQVCSWPLCAAAKSLLSALAALSRGVHRQHPCTGAKSGYCPTGLQANITGGNTGLTMDPLSPRLHPLAPLPLAATAVSLCLPGAAGTWFTHLGYNTLVSFSAFLLLAPPLALLCSIYSLLAAHSDRCNPAACTREGWSATQPRTAGHALRWHDMAARCAAY